MEKTRRLCGLVVLGMFLWFLPTIGEAVSVDCTTQYLQPLINQYPAGTFFVVTGICYENITISEIKERVTIDGGGTATIIGQDTENATIYVRGQGVTIRGLTISGGSNGIQVYHGGTAVIDSNIIQNTGRGGIVIGNFGFARIINNTISSNPGYGIYVLEGSAARIGVFSTIETEPSPNMIEGNGDHGIFVTRSSDARIVGNTISNNAGDGVHVDRVSHADISANTINHNSGDGIEVSQGSGADLGSDMGEGIYDAPNITTINNGGRGLSCSIGGYVNGRLGSLTGEQGKKHVMQGCFSSVK